MLSVKIQQLAFKDRTAAGGSEASVAAGEVVTADGVEVEMKKTRWEDGQKI